MVPEAGLEPAQGCPYRILSSLIELPSSTYRTISRKNIRISISLVLGCARSIVMVWAQHGHSKRFSAIMKSREPGCYVVTGGESGQIVFQTPEH